MSKRFQYWTRCITVATLASLMTFTPAWAGKGLRNLFKKRACCEVQDVCCDSSAVAACVIECEPTCEAAPAVISCPIDYSNVNCCDAAPIMMDAAPAAEAYTPAEMTPMETMPMEPLAPAIEDTTSSDESPQAEIESTDEPMESAAEVAPVVPSETEGSPSDAAPEGEMPADNLSGDPPAPSEETPATGASDLFGEDAAPAADPAPAGDDLFGTPPAADAAPAGDDLFGTPPAADAAPAGEDLFGTPPAADAAPAGDDLFGTPPAADAAPAADDFFGTPSGEAPPAGDDLFGTPPAADATPAGDDLFGTPSDEAPPAGDLFGTPPAADAAPAGDDLFGTPPADPAEDLFGQPTSTEAGSDDLNDLFGTPASEEAEDKATDQDPFGDLFKTTQSRTWRDNTGNFEVTAKLSAILPEGVRLLKDNGNFCTVPMRRLSEIDRQLVERIAAQLPGSDVKYISVAK